jgi:hypothetical protein
MVDTLQSDVILVYQLKFSNGFGSDDENKGNERVD